MVSSGEVATDSVSYLSPWTGENETLTAAPIVQFYRVCKSSDNCNGWGTSHPHGPDAIKGFFARRNRIVVVFVWKAQLVKNQ